MRKVKVVAIIFLWSLISANVAAQKFFIGRFEKTERRGDFDRYTFVDDKDNQRVFVRNATRKLLPYHLSLFDEANPEFTDLWFEITFTVQKVLPSDSLPGDVYNEIEIIKLIKTPNEFDHPKTFVGTFYHAEIYADTALYVFTDQGYSDLKFMLGTNEQEKIEYPLLGFTMANTKYLGKTFEITYKKRYMPGLNAASGELISIKMFEAKR